MAVSSGFTEYLKESLAPLGSIVIKRMFGGAGLYCDGIFFAIVDDDVLYLKTDDAGRAAFAAEGMGPFTYQMKSGEGVLASYYRAPERLLDEADELRAWGRRAVDAAHQAAAGKKKPAPRAPASRKSKTAKGRARR